VRSHHVLACLIAATLAGCGGDAGAPPQEPGKQNSTEASAPPSAGRTDWAELGHIAYVLPDKLPAGWTVRVATERPGRPVGEWTDHIEVLANKNRNSYLILGAHKSSSTKDDSFDKTDGEVTDMGDADNFAYLLAYVVRQDAPLPEGHARGVRQRANGLDLMVAEVADEPDDAMIERVAEEFAEVDSLNFQIPASAGSQGFASVGSSPSDTLNVADYSVSWVPQELAGANRTEAVEAPDEGPLLFVNVGAAFYAQTSTASTDPSSAPISKEGALLRIEFLVDGSIVTVSGRQVSEDALRAVATSLRTYDRSEWRALLGDRLLVDEPDE
jgi:hypothetical protein